MEPFFPNKTEILKASKEEICEISSKTGKTVSQIKKWIDYQNRKENKIINKIIEDYLVLFFNTNPNPSKKDYSELSKITGEESSKISKWFRNKRYNTKSLQKD